MSNDITYLDYIKFLIKTFNNKTDNYKWWANIIAHHCLMYINYYKGSYEEIKNVLKSCKFKNEVLTIINNTLNNKDKL